MTHKTGGLPKSLVLWAPLTLLILLTSCARTPLTTPPPTATRESVARAEPSNVAPESRPRIAITATASPQSAQRPTATPLASPSPTPPPPTAIPSPTPTPTPAPQLRRLTSGGCCTQPFWAPGSDRVLYIDRPAPAAPLGIWGIDIRASAAPELWAAGVDYYTPDLAFRLAPDGDRVTIERLADGARWAIDTGGANLSISPGRQRVAWQRTNQDMPFEQRTAEVWVANLDGSEPRAVATMPRGGFRGWISDDHLLLEAQPSLDSRTEIFYAFSLLDNTLTELVRSERLQGTLLSPDGQWLAYYVALSNNPAENGLWLMRSDGTERRQLDPALFGAYQWRDSDRLVLIPLGSGTGAQSLWEYNAETGETRRLTDPQATPIQIANGDWRLSPDGRHIAYVASHDHNLWLLTLPQ